MIYITSGVFLLLFVIVGMLASKQISKNDSEDYFLAGRKLNKWQIGISAGATANSGFIVVGAVGMGYSIGMASLIYPLSWLLGDLAFWYLFAERIRANEAVNNSITVPQVLMHEHKSKFLQMLAGVIILILLAVYASSQLIASYKVVSSFVEISTQTSLLLSFVFVIAYTVWGGFKSSVWTDILQGIMMLLLTLGVLVWGLYEVGGLGAFINKLNAFDAGYLDLGGGRSLGAFFAFVLGFAFTGFGFSMSQPQVISRLFAGSSAKEAKDARWVYITFLHFTWIGMGVIGIIAKILMPDLPDGELALPVLAKTYFPEVLVGAVFAGMVATILSSVDSLLVASSSALTVDLGLDEKFSKEKKVWLYRFSIIAIGLVTLALSMFLESTVFAIALFAVSVMTASIGAAMVLVVLNLAHSSKTLTVAVISGLVVALFWRYLGYENIVNEGFVGFIAALILAVGYDRIFEKRN